MSHNEGDLAFSSQTYLSPLHTAPANLTLENAQSAKYLGITITENMDRGQHISDISSKTNLAFTPRSTKEAAYKTKLLYALNWNMQHLFGAHIVKLRFNRWRRYRGRHPLDLQEVVQH